MVERVGAAFSPEIPPDLAHAALIREEAIDWLESAYPGDRSFTTGEILRMSGEEGRRWLIARLRDQGIGNEETFSLPAAADALTVLFLRSRGVKFREAVDAVVGDQDEPRTREPRYGGVWNRLIRIALRRMRRRLSARLLGSAIFALLRDPEDHPNCLVVVRPVGREKGGDTGGEARLVSHDEVYRTVLERPAPSCWVLSPLREVLFLDVDQLPTRSEITSRHFRGLLVGTDRESYEVLLGTVRGAQMSLDATTVEFVGRILDVVFHDYEEFLRVQSGAVFETSTVPELSKVDDLQLWLITQFLNVVYPGSLSEISEAPTRSEAGKVLATSVARPWEPSPWDPPKALEMLSGYASRVGVPLVVERVEQPWLSLIESVEPEMRYLEGVNPGGGVSREFSAVALPIHVSSGASIGALYLLTPLVEAPRLDVEVRVLTVFSRIIGEVIERQKAAMHTANVSTHVATFDVLRPGQMRDALLDLLDRKSGELGGAGQIRRDMRLAFLLLSAHATDTDGLNPDAVGPLKSWLVETLRHLEWRSFVRSHLAWVIEGPGDRSFIGELPDAGLVVALDRLVSKDELDQIRSAFPTEINRTYPTNAPVKLVAWVLDVPAHRILKAAKDSRLPALADDIQRWAFDVATVVDDVAQSEVLAHRGEWDAALRLIRRAIGTSGGRENGYLFRLAAECSFSLGDWPSALKYSQQAVHLETRELESGFVRSMCQEADAHLCLCDPVAAWDLYTKAASEAPAHPLPRYYRGQALLMIARLLDRFEKERQEAVGSEATDPASARAAVNELVNGAIEDLTSAADLLDRWGLIPQSSQYRNFHLVPTLMGLGAGYLLSELPGPAASRLQSARRSFPRDDLFLREYLFAKCWEQGVHRQYGALLTGDGWTPMRERLAAAFGGPWTG